jgi:hypothetical protein
MYSAKDGFKDGSPLGFELGFVRSSDDSCSKDWRDVIKDGFKDGQSLGFVMMAAAMMAEETVSRMALMILHDMVEKIKRLEIELDCILKIVSPTREQQQELRLLEALRILTISNTVKEGMRRVCSDLVIMIKNFSLQAHKTTVVNPDLCAVIHSCCLAKILDVVI